MINLFEVKETNDMVEHENLDVRTITMGISLLDCIDSDIEKLNEKIYNKIYCYIIYNRLVLCFDSTCFRKWNFDSCLWLFVFRCTQR